MGSEKSVSKWYDLVGEECLKFYKESNKKELIILRKLIKELPKNASILDVGCGTGRPAKFLIQKGYRVLGIDISRKMIEVAKKNVPKAQFKIMNMYNMRFKNKQFDAIIAFFSILHIEKKKLTKIFKDFNKILKDKGYFLFSVNEGKKEGYFEFFGKKTYFSEYTKEEIEDLLKKTKFKIITQKDFLVKGEKDKELTMYYLVQKIL